MGEGQSKTGEMKGILLAFVLAVGLAAVSCTSSPSNNDTEPSTKNTEKCQEPENPYDEGSGHYAGYEWAEKNNPASCGGSSQSFIEGCEDYQEQESAYEECTSKK